MFDKKIVVLGTGGTIAGAASGPDGYLAAQISVQNLLESVPGLSELGFEVQAEQVAQIDSKDMDWVVWQRLLVRCQYWLKREDVQGLVLTHGTDTLEETAYFLQTVLAPRKPVVITCAMRPATAADADGPQNIRDAFALASHTGVQGVLVVCAGQIHGARDVQKVHPTRLDPFSSGDVGPVGQVQAGQVRLQTNWPLFTEAWSEVAISKLTDQATIWPRVEILMSHTGASAALVDTLVSPEVALQMGVAPVRGLVIAATGNGTLHESLAAALVRAQDLGVRVQRSTRCCLGPVVSMNTPVLPDANGLSAVKARIALMLELLLKDSEAV